MRKRIILLLLLLFLLLLSQVFALESCPDPNNVTECCIMDKPGYGYYLSTDIKANGDCFLIKGSTGIRCQNHTIIGTGNGIAINISGTSTAVVRDCIIRNFSTAINIEPDSDATEIIFNKIYNNERGILFNAKEGLPPSYGAIVRNNIIINNLFGVHIRKSKENKIYNNYFANNYYNAYDDSGYENYWNTTKTQTKNIISGPFIGGNYWNDYSGEDTDGDGLGNTSLPYDSSGWILIGGDYLPLVDINPPKYSNLTLSNSSLTTYTLNITWKDNLKIDKVLIELDGVNYTAQKINESQILTPSKIEYSANYSKTFENLEEGTHYYRWYANDSSNNWNSTDLLSFTVGAPTTTTSSIPTTTTTIPSGCTGPVTLTFSPNPTWASKTVTANIDGLAGCDGKTAYLRMGKYKILRSYCTVSGSGCSINFMSPNALTSGKNYTYYAQVDLNGNGALDEGEEASENLTVYCHAEGEACSSNEPCCSNYYCSEGICKKVTGGCPILKAWDGKEFKEIEKLNIHSKEGVDTQYSTQFRMKPFDKNTYKIILQEKWYMLWEGSHVDYVKLTDSTGRECKLIKAIHSKLGDVTSLISESDDERVETKPGQSVELTFADCSGNDFTLTIEGFNPWWRFVKLGLSNKNLPMLLGMILLSVIIMLVVFGVFKFIVRSKEST